MKKRINLHGEDLYYLSDIIEKYSLSSTYATKSNVIGRVIHFGQKDYVNAENYCYLEQLALLETTCYTISKACTVLQLTDYALVSQEKLLTAMFHPKEFGGIIFYPREEVDEVAVIIAGSTTPISAYLHIICGENIIYIRELYRYAADQKVSLLGRRTPGLSIAHMLFPPGQIVDVFGNLSVRCPTSISDLLSDCQKTTAAEMFDNLFLASGRKPITYSLMRKFYIRKVNASKSPRHYDIAMDYIRPLYRIYCHLEKEITEYAEAGLLRQVLTKPWSNNKTAMQFYQFVKDTSGTGFGKNLSFVYQALYDKTANHEIYSYKDWGALYDYLLDLKTHTGPAYTDWIYAQYWCIMLVHMTSFLRISDIVSVRTAGLDGTRFVEPRGLEKRPLELHEAVTITKLFKSQVELLPTVKTDQFRHYYPLVSVMPAIATAVSILDYHRIRNDDNRLFTVNGAHTERIANKFEGIPIDFQSTKATKTLATLVHAKAEESGKKNALFLVSAGRSHVIHDGFSETTAIYLQESQLEGDPIEIARYVCNRGVFGWLYVAMLRFINSEIGSLAEATTQVEWLMQRLSPEQLERISGFLLHTGNEQKTILRQLSGYDRQDISEFLMNIGTQKAATNLPETFCIFGYSCSKSRADQYACLRCGCSLKTNYTLELVGNRLEILLDTMRHLPYESITERQKLTFQIQQLLFVLMDAKAWYDKYDPHFLAAYVDLPSLQASLAAIPDSKFLLTERKDHE